MATIYVDKENQGVSHGALKTAPKTPFARKAGVVRTPFAAKTKENSNICHTAKASSTDATKLFKTPNEKRVPLGGKDANARQNAVRPTSAVKQTSARRRTKQTSRQDVAQVPSTPIAVAVSDVPDIEYMPPRSKELPFAPEDFEPIDYAALNHNIRNANLADYLYPRDKDGLTKVERKVKQIFENPNNEYIDDDFDQLFLHDDDGLLEFEKPLTLDEREWDGQDAGF